jgi:hypothetical protein
MSLAAEYAQRIIVMGGKGILMDGNPREVFYRASELAAARILQPQIIRLSLELRKELNLELDSLNAAEMGRALLRNKTQ